jgi:hypothetical protein
MELFNRNFVRLIAIITLLSVTLIIRAGLAAEPIPAGWAAENIRPIGYSDLDGRGGAFKMAIKELNGRWYLYMGHLWNRGWSIVDVTDPAAPKVVKFISGPENTWTIQMDLHDNIMITALQSCGPAWGCDPAKPFEEGVLIWDISDPVNPKQLSHWKTGSTGTHRNVYPGGKYTYLSAGMPGFQGNILVILDISDPAHPEDAGRWWMPGQKDGEARTKPDIGFHGPVMLENDTAYLGYGPAVVILDLTDKSRPKLIGRLDTSPPFKGGSMGEHDVLKIPGKPLLFAHSEAGGGDTPDGPPPCSEPLDLAGMVDVSDLTKPRLISTLPLPVPPKGAPYTDFCDKAGRFGPHNTNIEQHLPDVEKQGDLIYLTYFNAGLRIFDIKNPRVPREVAWFIPPTPTKRIGLLPAKLVNQTEDVLVDRRGNIYITDKQWGLFVLRYTGKRQLLALRHKPVQ